MTPTRVTRDPELAEWRDQMLRRDLRICEWLGLAPGHIIKITDDDPNEHGEVEIHWESTQPELPRHGKVTNTGARGAWGEPTLHSGSLRLHPVDAEQLLEVAGPRPSFPISAEDRAALEQLRRSVC